VNGAVEESMHVYVNAGFRPLLEKLTSIHILEVGFGTGLNALLTEAIAPDSIEVFYTAIEAYPLQEEEISMLNYDKICPAINQENILNLHHLPWDNCFHRIRPHFWLKKVKSFLEDYALEENQYDLVYFDAFAPDVQPELWDKRIFRSIYQSMREEGLFCTYSAKGEVRRRLQEVGFTIERLAGACGKREMLRARK
jgi:tRNA U34 5-methylaminomethyl-2-thiouridine-forming methyltransferase MnmC